MAYVLDRGDLGADPFEVGVVTLFEPFLGLGVQPVLLVRPALGPIIVPQKTARRIGPTRTK